jgi:hypothetical protein
LRAVSKIPVVPIVRFHLRNQNRKCLRPWLSSTSPAQRTGRTNAVKSNPAVQAAAAPVAKAAARRRFWFRVFPIPKPKIRERLRSELKRPRDEFAVDLIGTYTLDPDP